MTARKLLILGLLALAACGEREPLVTSPAISLVDGGALPPPGRDDLYARDRPYLIGPFDKLEIDVFGIEAMKQRKVQTDASGRISFPLAGVMEAAGKTPGELADMIEERLRGRFIKDPQVTVNLDETVSQVVTVEGEVEEPGLFPVIGKMTLMRAVARAKGTTEFAKLGEVVIFRTVDGKQMAALYSLKAIRRGQYEDPEVFANDVVVVGDSRARRIFKDILQASPLITTPIIALIR